MKEQQEYEALMRRVGAELETLPPDLAGKFRRTFAALDEMDKQVDQLIARHRKLELEAFIAGLAFGGIMAFLYMGIMNCA